MVRDPHTDVGTIAGQVGATVPTVSHHLAKLKLAGLVRSRREGRHQIYLVDDPHIVTIVRQMVDRMQDQPAGSRRGRGVGA